MKKLLSITILSTLAVAMVTPVHAQYSATGSAGRKEQLMNTKMELQKDKKEMIQLTKENRASTSAKKVNMAILSDGIVTGINGTSLTVTKEGKTYAVTTTSDTTFRRNYGGLSSLAEFAPGNHIDVRGQWTDSTMTAIAARTIRNRSLMKVKGTFFGEVVSKSGNTIVITSKNRGNQTITVEEATKYLTRKEVATTLSAILAGHTIRVHGMWDKSNNTLTQVTKIKDFSLPAKVSVTPTRAASVSASPTATTSAITQ